ncbi:unnamed protein product [Penicillium discolor]
MLRTWRPERDRHVVLIVDTGRTAAARVGDGTRLDAALEAALLLSALASRAGDHVHLLMHDRVTRARVTGEVYLAAAAERTLRDAENVADAIRRAGGEAIAADPEDLPPRIADRYLELKAAGRL